MGLYRVLRARKRLPKPIEGIKKTEREELI